MLVENCLRFVPSRVDGVRDVVEAAVYPDRLELRCADRLVVYRFDEIAEWPSPAWLWRLFALRTPLLTLALYQNRAVLRQENRFGSKAVAQIGKDV